MGYFYKAKFQEICITWLRYRMILGISLFLEVLRIESF